MSSLVRVVALSLSTMIWGLGCGSSDGGDGGAVSNCDMSKLGSVSGCGGMKAGCDGNHGVAYSCSDGYHCTLTYADWCALGKEAYTGKCGTNGYGETLPVCK